MSEFQDALSKHLFQFATIPFLFVGSGMSQRYYNLPTWINLLKAFYPKLENTAPFNYYSSKCGNNPVLLAAAMSADFHEIWWKKDAFADSRSKYEHIAGADIEIP